MIIYALYAVVVIAVLYSGYKIYTCMVAGNKEAAYAYVVVALMFVLMGYTGMRAGELRDKLNIYEKACGENCICNQVKSSEQK